MTDSHEITVRVRYAETDRMGLLHHANYFVYLRDGPDRDAPQPRGSRTGKSRTPAISW